MVYDFESIYTVYCQSEVCKFVRTSLMSPHKAKQYINKNEDIKTLYKDYKSNVLGKSYYIHVVSLCLKDICNISDVIPRKCLFVIAVWTMWTFPYYYEFARKLLK